MPPYKHRQFGSLMVIGLGAGLIMMLLILFSASVMHPTYTLFPDVEMPNAGIV